MKRVILASAMALAVLGGCNKNDDEPLVYETSQDSTPEEKPYQLPEFYNKYVKAPSGFDKQANVAHGKYENITYKSEVAGTNKTAYVYLPANYSTSKKYPVLYLLHGIGGTQDEWRYGGTPEIIIDNVIAQGLAKEMIFVLPNGRAMKDPSPGADCMAGDKIAGFHNFENELINELVPYIDKKYSTYADKNHRALAGLSMGGGQSLDFGLRHLEVFAYVGAFSPAPHKYSNDQIFSDIAKYNKNCKLFWVTCGTNDGTTGAITNDLENYCKQKNISHGYVPYPGGVHDFTVWKYGLYCFSQMIFR